MQLSNNTCLDTQADVVKLRQVLDKSLIIFDWDGTLMDSIRLIVESMHVAGAAHGFKTTDQAVKDIIGLTLLTGVEIVFPNASPEQHLAIQNTYTDYYIPNSHRTPFFDSIENMLQTLQHQGKKMAVATGKKRRGLDRVLAHSESHHYFDITRCADESGSKPDPQMLIDILAHTQQSVADAVFIGDSIYDIQMANQLGMTSIAVNYGAASKTDLAEQQPTYQVDTPQALFTLLCGQGL